MGACVIVTCAVFSIRPYLAELLFQGKKLFEYRKCHVQPPVGGVGLIYETRPRSLVSGIFSIGRVIRGTAYDLERLEPDPLVRQFVREYLDGCSNASAVEVLHPRRFEQPLTISSLGLRSAPQSYAFATLKVEEWDFLECYE